MKSWSTLFVYSLLFAGVSATNEMSSDCVATHLLPVITTSASALILTDLMPEATSAAPAPGSDKLPEPHSGSGPGAGNDPASIPSQANPHNTSPASVEPIAHGGIPVESGEGSGYVKPTGAAATPSSSTHPDYTSGAPNEGASKTGRAVFVALSLALIIQSAGSV
ncbi:hypothetical protein FANTH_13556 [Fusarium anthophilum]|uniref:Uncharacterized protein n=1 Tax=Fusarium anthophilum TaxID=48485 RepID=A0A8H4YN52_9HYPO|nr:hypothetical protein FANTH_13556 [Fusarium anthophilum]